MNKPAFNPNQPFEEVNEKPQFDPSQPFEELDGMEPMTLRGFGENLKNKIIENVKGAAAIGSIASNYYPANPRQLYDAAAGNPVQLRPPIERDAAILGQTAKELPGAIVESVTRYKDPVRAVYDDPVSAALDAATGASLLKPLSILGKNVARKTGEVAGKTLMSGAGKVMETPVGRRFLSALLGPSEEAIAARMANPKRILKATNEAKIAERLEGGLRTVEGKIADVENRVGKTLKASPYLAEGATGKDDILSAIQKARDEIGFTVTPDEQYAKGILDNVTENLRRLRNTVSEKQLRDLVQKVSNAIPYGAKEYGTNNLALMRLRNRLDSFLKKNPAYRELMKQEVPLQRLKTDLIDDFGLKRSVGEGMKATDATASKLTNVLKDSKEVRSQRILKRLKDVTGEDYIQQVRDWQVAEQFQPGMTRPNGSRRVNWASVSGSGTLGTVGATVGGMVGGLPGAVVGGGLGGALGGVGGAMVGGYMDKQGGAIAAKLIDMYLKKKSSGVASAAMNPIAAEYAPALIDAVEKTGISLEEAAASLGQSDPTFKRFLLEVIHPESSRPKRILKNRKAS